MHIKRHDSDYSTTSFDKLANLMPSHMRAILKSTWELVCVSQKPKMQLDAQMTISVQLSIFVHRAYDIYRINSERIS